MLNVVDFLERVGQDARLRHASPVDVEAALTNVLIEPELRLAVRGGNYAQLKASLGCADLISVQFPGKEDEEEDQDGGEGEEHQESSLAGPGVQPLPPVHDASLAA